MKKSAIRDIFNGLKGHRETMNMPDYDKGNMEIVCNAYDELKEKMSPELFSLHRKLVDALEENWCEEVDFHFVEGFKLGILIGMECMEE